MSPELTPPSPSPNRPLTETEKLVIQLVESERSAKMAKVLGDLERRLGLPPGSIGRTHVIEMTSGVVVPMPQQPPPPQPGGEVTPNPAGDK